MPRLERRVLRVVGSYLALAGAAAFVACGWNPSRPFDRDSPVVNEAIATLDGGDAQAAASLLEGYLSTGECSDGNIGAPALVHRRPDGTFDLGLSLFRVGESFGGRFGDEEHDAGMTEKARAAKGAQIGCALRVVDAIAGDESVPLELRARAHYLAGNLNFLDGEYEAAVHEYDQAITLSPGQVDAGDPIGRDAAWNRAIALRRIEDKKDAGSDGGNDGSSDASQDSGKDGAADSGGKDSGGGDTGSGGEDSGRDSSSGEDSGGSEAGQPPPPPPSSPDAAPPPPETQNQDDRILDQLENAPTVQQEAAKKAAALHRVRGMADK